MCPTQAHHLVHITYGQYLIYQLFLRKAVFKKVLREHLQTVTKGTRTVHDSHEASVMVHETLAWVWETDCSLSPGRLAVC